MSDLVDQYNQSLPSRTDKDKAAQQAGQQVADALSNDYREAQSIQLEKYRNALAELEEVKQLLTT